MSITYSAKIQAVSTSSGNYTTASFNSTNGNLILVFFAPTRNASTASDWSSGMTVSNSQGLTVSYPGKVLYYNNGSNWDVGICCGAFVSNGSAMTVTCASGAGVTNYSMQVIVLEVTGSSGTVSGLVTNNAITNGALSLTLGAAPATGDDTLYVQFWSVGASSGATPYTGTDFVSMNAASGTWTRQAENLGTTGNFAGGLSVHNRTGSTSTTVSVTDTWTLGDSLYGGAAMAFNLAAAAAAAVSDVPLQALNVRNNPLLRM